MTHSFGALMFTPEVKDLQARMGSRGAYEKFEAAQSPAHDEITDREADFISARDTFYMATVSSTGWPYVQHRGGPIGFLKVLDAKTLGFADYRGNRQYISAGNLLTDDRVSLFLIDYPNRRRLKILGRARTIGTEADDAAKLLDAAYGARVERGFLVSVEAFDWNCPQHITPRFTADEMAETLAPLRERLAALEAENATLRSMLGPGAAAGC